MTRELTDRTARISIGRRGRQGKAWPAGNDGLRVDLEVKKHPSKTPNTATIKLFNLSQKSRNFINTDQVVSVTAGYQQTQQGIFFGDIQRVKRGGDEESLNESEDKPTTIEAGDGIGALKNATIQKSFAPGVSAEQIANSLEDELGIGGVSRGFVEAIRDVEGLRNGFSASGKVRSELDALFAGTQYDWSIQDDKLEIVGESGVAQSGVVVLRPDTGLLEANRLENGNVEVKALMMGKIKPNRRLKVEGRDVKGVFKVTKVTHSGDTHGDNWQTEAICE